MANEGQGSEEQKRAALMKGFVGGIYDKDAIQKAEIAERRAEQAKAERIFNAAYQEIKAFLKREPKEEDAVLLAGKLGISPEQALMGIRNWRAENLQR